MTFFKFDTLALKFFYDVLFGDRNIYIKQIFIILCKCSFPLSKNHQRFRSLDASNESKVEVLYPATFTSGLKNKMISAAMALSSS